MEKGWYVLVYVLYNIIISFEQMIINLYDLYSNGERSCSIHIDTLSIHLWHETIQSGNCIMEHANWDQNTWNLTFTWHGL